MNKIQVLDDLWETLTESASLLLAPIWAHWLAETPFCTGVSLYLYDHSGGYLRQVCTFGQCDDAFRVVRKAGSSEPVAEVRCFGTDVCSHDIQLPDGLDDSLAWLAKYQQQLLADQIFSYSPIIQYEAAELDGRWVLTRVNRALSDFLGVEPAQLLGKRAPRLMSDFIHPEDVTMLMTSYDMTRTTSKQMTLQYRLRSASGDYVPVTERVVYVSDVHPRRCISTVWHRQLDQIDSQVQYQLFHDIQSITGDMTMLSGREFLHHFCRRLEALNNVQSLSLLALTGNDWWESWALYQRETQLPDCHIQLNHSDRLRRVSWNQQRLFETDAVASRTLYGSLPYQSVIPLNFDGEPVVACLILGSGQPLKDTEQVMQLIRLLGLRVLREIKQVIVAEAQWEQNLQLQQQKQQLTQMVNLLGDLDTIADDPTFMVTTQNQLHRTFNLKSIHWAIWDAGEWRLVDVEPGSTAKQRLGASRPVIEEPWLNYLEETRSTAEMAIYRGRLRVFWPVGSGLNGFMVVVLTFRKAVPDTDLLAFAQNAVALAHQGLVQRENLHRQAMYDSLTGLGNRMQLHAWIKVALPSQQQASLILFDLNRFKEINDSFGHQFGDRLLCEIGPRISATLNKREHYLSRLGGDEFALFLPDTDQDESGHLAGLLYDKLAESYTIDTLRFQVEASIGVAHYPQHGDDGHELLRCADVAMYAAKHSNRRVVVFESELDNLTPMRIAVLSELDQAIAQNQLSVAYQPLMETISGQTTGFEALVRWTHPTYGELSPGEFIHLAEVGEGIRKITDFVLQQTLQFLVIWRRQKADLHVAINISPRVLLDHDFPNHVNAMLRDYDLPGDAIIMELTESTLLVDPIRAIEIIQSLSDLGIKFEIDDFGTGYSSLAYLKRLPISALKIDQSFVTDIIRDSHNEVIVQSTVQMAHNLGLQVVAEGVEDEATLLKMRRLGCDMIQGYYFSKPISGVDVDGWLTRNL